MANQNLQSVKDKFEAAVEDNDGIETFIGDDLSKINTKRDADIWPLLLLNFPENGRVPDKRVNKKQLDVTFFIYTPHKRDDETDEWTVLDNLEALGYDVIDFVVDRVDFFEANTPFWIDIGYGHLEHNARLIGVRFDIKIQYNDCRNE